MLPELDGLIEKAKRDKDVLAVVMFGSAARGEKYSDIDISLVLLPRKYSDLRMSRKRLNYLTSAPSNFDIQIFQQIPLYIRIQVLKEGKVVYCKNEDTFYELAYRTAKEFEYFRPRYEEYLEAVARA